MGSRAVHAQPSTAPQTPFGNMESVTCNNTRNYTCKLSKGQTAFSDGVNLIRNNLRCIVPDGLQEGVVDRAWGAILCVEHSLFAPPKYQLFLGLYRSGTTDCWLFKMW